MLAASPSFSPPAGPSALFWLWQEEAPPAHLPALPTATAPHPLQWLTPRLLNPASTGLLHGPPCPFLPTQPITFADPYSCICLASYLMLTFELFMTFPNWGILSTVNLWSHLFQTTQLTLVSGFKFYPPRLFTLLPLLISSCFQALMPHPTPKEACDTGVFHNSFTQMV